MIGSLLGGHLEFLGALRMGLSGEEKPQISRYLRKKLHGEASELSTLKTWINIALFDILYFDRISLFCLVGGGFHFISTGRMQ